MKMGGKFEPAKMPEPKGMKPAHGQEKFGSKSMFKEPSSQKKLAGFKPPKM